MEADDLKNLRYTIYEISALELLSSAAENTIRFEINDRNKEYIVHKTYQEDCALYYQTMATLGKQSPGVGICDDLSDVLCYIDFSGVFDRSPVGKTLLLQQKAEKMFLEDGVELDFGKGYRKYIAFERSASMSRESRLCFVRKDIAKPLYKRIQLGMAIGMCQLSKLYAYNGLMFTDGRRIEFSSLLNDKRMIVIDNPKSVVPDVSVITVEDDGTENAVRKYTRVEKTMDVSVEEFDGEGLVSKEYAKLLDDTEEHLHHSFQIRLPYIKGVLHEVDYKSLFSELGVTEITDIFGVKHPVSDVDIILTKSMFKGYGWMKENGLSWSEYLSRMQMYGHALYVSGTDQTEADCLTELNYQFLNTAAVSSEQFRPKSFPGGWDHSPTENEENWLTKATETEYYNLACDNTKRIEYFLKDLSRSGLSIVDRRRKRAELLQKNGKYINEAVFTRELDKCAEQLRLRYSVGKLQIAGDNRYLSDDLMRLLSYIVKTSGGESFVLDTECLCGNQFYAPKANYPECESYTLLRNPHIARNEEARVIPLKEIGTYRGKYLSHLHYVVMVDSRSLIPDRLGGADYDGDMVKTVADPLLNDCISGDFPLLKIPAAEPLLRDAKNAQDRLAVVKSTFSSRVGQISNAALRRSIVAYDENIDLAERKRLQEETETLAILTGLEIDSAKSGIKPDLSDYLSAKKVKSLFLQYKNMVDVVSDGEKTEKTRLQRFFDSVDWNSITSNTELLPYYAKLLGEQSRKAVLVPATDEELFIFAADPNWKDKLNKTTLEKVASIIADYEEAGKRCRYYRHDIITMRRQKDIRRILFLQNKEDQYSVEELYHAFDETEPYRIREIRKRLEESEWHFTKPEERELAFYDIVGYGACTAYTDVFCDFSHSGFRLLWDVLSDLDDMYAKKTFRDNKAVKKNDTPQMKDMLRSVTTSRDYREQLISNCMQILQPSDARKERIALAETVKCAVALGKRSFAMEVLPSTMLELTVPEAPERTPKKRRLFGR